MKSETYIVPAIKYYLVKLTEEAEEYIKNVGEDLGEYSAHKLLKKGTYFIPFKEVEGLTVDEIAQLLEVNNYFIVIARTEIDACSVISDYYFKTGYKTSKTDFSWNSMCSVYLVNIYEENALKPTFKTTRIEEEIESYMEKIYYQSSNFGKKIIRHFLEMYRYLDYEKTKEKVKQMEINVNKE